MQPVWFTFLNGSDIEQLELTDIEILDAVEDGLRGYVAPLAPAGVKIVGDRGLSLSDIALGAAMLRKTEERGLGQNLRFS
ncbi:hypothetical protein [Streptomyces adelaidensis]|uniref:hypothetical protein n=1 Tax=Streptomyces adelaidensis TaxID=2796465 RepID=UPI0019075483|nr:hypothetical protein [Streptomyces adelaidensis]